MVPLSIPLPMSAEPDTSRIRKANENALDKSVEHNDVAQLRRIANATLSVREVSAQEALWMLVEHVWDVTQSIRLKASRQVGSKSAIIA